MWLKTSGFASKTFLYASPFLKKSGVKTSIVVFGFAFLVWLITSKKWFEPPSSKSSRSTDVITTCLRFNFFTAVKKLNLKHVVITSVDRDDLDDGGSNHFFEVINQTRKANPNTTIEVLTPDFLRKGDAYKKVLEANPDVFNHNIETVPSLYLKVRPGSRYFASLELLKNAKMINKKIFTKSGIMVGLGEKKDEILQVMDDLKAADVDFLTIGQYLQPSVRHHPLDRYYTPEEFDELGSIAKSKGFLLVSSSPLTRSSYHADEDFAKLKQNRINNH